MPFNFWFVHTPPGGHIDGTSGDCDLNQLKKVQWFNVPLWSCLGVNPLVMPRTPYQASEGKRSKYPTMPYHPHPHIIICTSFHLIN